MRVSYDDMQIYFDLPETSSRTFVPGSNIAEPWAYTSSRSCVAPQAIGEKPSSLVEAVAGIQHFPMSILRYSIAHVLLFKGEIDAGMRIWRLLKKRSDKRQSTGQSA